MNINETPLGEAREHLSNHRSAYSVNCTELTFGRELLAKIPFRSEDAMLHVARNVGAPVPDPF